MAKVIFDGAGEMPELNRITAKKNYASSSQAHKMGATAMFNDILHYLGKEKYPKLINEVGGRVAVRQHPVYAFQKIPIEGSEGQYNRKFIGLFTVGPDKGDKNYFGFTNSRIKDRAIRLEGTDHLKGVGFNYPWIVNGVDKIKYNHAEESLCIVTGSDKTKWTKIWEQSVCGNKETEAEIEAYLKEVYKPAYEVAYHNNPLIVGVDMTLSEINSNIEAFGKRRRVKDNRQYSYCEFWIDGEYDIYYLDAQTNKYEKNGINLLSDLGITADEIAGMTIEEKNNLFISKRVARFKEEAKYYFCIDDAIYQLMFLFIIVASDNFEKNMYPYIMELLWRFFQDDLDSIFSTDNQAQNTKKYSAELHDFTDDTKSAYVFKGEDSAFWQLIELAYEDECKQMGRDIFQAMYDLAPKGTTTMEKLMAFFDEYFFNRAQKYFTPSAYNNDTEYSYEEAWNNKEYVASVDIHPLAQALGSQESTERAFLEKRLIYLMSKFSFGGFGSATDTDLGIISVRTQDPQSFTLTPAIDLYPTVLGGQAQSAVATERVIAGQPVTLPAVGGGNTNVYIVGADWLSDIGDLKDLKVDPSSVVTLTISSKRLRRIKVGDENPDSVTSYLGSLSIQKCDSLETIDARNLQTLVGTVDLSNCPRLVEALFGGSNANAIIIAPGSKVEKLQFSDSITTIDLRNNTFLKDVEITNFAKIRFLRLENVPIINGFDVLRQAYNTDGQQLENIRIIGFTYTGVADDLFMLSNIAEGKDKDGNAHKYGSIDANGDPDENSLPIIEGSLHITESVNRTTYDFVQGAFHALALTADNIVDYVIFADPEVSRIVAENWGDDTGTTVEQIEAIADIGTKFANNTLIETFDELKDLKNVQSLSSNAFSNCTNLKSIDLSNIKVFNGTYYTQGTFNGCTSLQDIGSLENLEVISPSAFNGCANLVQDIYMPKLKHFYTNQTFTNSGITKFEALNVESSERANNTGAGVFQNCLNLKHIVINKIINTGSDFASGCKSLEEVTIGECTVIGNSTFKDCINLKSFDFSTTLTIDNNAFAGCSKMVIKNTDKIQSVGMRSFEKCDAIEEINFPSLLSINRSCFSSAKNIKRITNLGTVTTLSAYEFDSGGITCAILEYIEYPETITNLGQYTYGQNRRTLNGSLICKAKTPPTCQWHSFPNGTYPIYVPDASVEAYKTATNWNAHASRIQSIFYYLGYIDFVDPAVRDICVANFDTDADGVVSMEEAAAVTDIGSLFKNNTSIESFDEFKYFENVNLTGNSFNGCKLKRITLPNITTIPYNSFANSGLISIELPSSVTSVGSQAFQGSSNLVEVVFKGNTPPQINAFLSCNNLKVIKPHGSNESSFKTLNDNLYSYDGKILYAVPFGNDVLETDSVETIYDNAFRAYSGGTTSLNFASVTNIKRDAFNGSKIQKITLSKECTLGDYTFANSSLEVLVANGIKAIPYECFASSKLTSLVLNFDYIAKLSYVASLRNTPIANGTGYIYVPDNLVEDYKVAANWSTYANQIKPLSEYVES